MHLCMWYILSTFYYQLRTWFLCCFDSDLSVKVRCRVRGLVGLIRVRIGGWVLCYGCESPQRHKWNTIRVCVVKHFVTNATRQRRIKKLEEEMD